MPAPMMRMSTGSSPWEGRIGRRPVVAVRLRLPPDALVDARRRHVRRARRLERQARVEIARGLAPQPALGAEPPERGEERSVARMGLQPALALLEPLEGVGLVRALGVERDELRGPLG